MVEVEKDLSLKFSGHCFFFCGISSLCVCIVNISPLHKAGVKVVNDCKTDDITLICYKVLGYAMAVQL